MKVLSRKEKPKFNSKPEPGSEDPKSKITLNNKEGERKK
jgi:hypothetical protein